MFSGEALSAIIFVVRKNVRLVLKRELKSLGFGVLIFADTYEDCLSNLAAIDDAVLILDEGNRESELLQILRASQGRFRIDTRPIFYIPETIEEQTMALAQEYNILHVYTGELSRAQLEKNVNEMISYGRRSHVQSEVFGRVIAARQAQKWNDAVTELAQLCTLEPGNVQAAVEYGFALCESERWEQAQQHLIGVVAQYPEDARAVHLLARCFLRKGDHAKARQYLEQAQLLNPMNVERLVELGRLFMEQQKVAEAKGAFEDALKLDPELRDAQIGQVQCELLIGDLNGALKMLRQFQDPQELASVFNGAAIVAVRGREFKQGIDLYKLATGYIQARQDLLSRVYYNMGLGLWKWGKGKLAQVAFERAVSIDPSNQKAAHNARKMAASVARMESIPTAVGQSHAPTINEAIDSMDEFGEIEDLSLLSNSRS